MAPFDTALITNAVSQEFRVPLMLRDGDCGTHGWRVRNLFALVHLTFNCTWIVPLQYVNAAWLVWLLRGPMLRGVWRVRV